MDEKEIFKEIFSLTLAMASDPVKRERIAEIQAAQQEHATSLAALVAQQKINEATLAQIAQANREAEGLKADRILQEQALADREQQFAAMNDAFGASQREWEGIRKAVDLGHGEREARIIQGEASVRAREEDVKRREDAVFSRQAEAEEWLGKATRMIDRVKSAIAEA